MPIASKFFVQHEISLMNAVIIEDYLNIQSVHMILVFSATIEKKTIN
jgi:hypothetical protein